MFADRKIVFVGGTWDLFHIGHLNIIEKAGEYGDKVVVGVSTDELVYKYKKIKPVIPLIERVAIIEALTCVDFVVIQKKLADVKLMKQLQVDVFVSGDDWKNKKARPKGYDWLEKNCKLVFLPRTDGISSTIIKQRLNIAQYE